MNLSPATYRILCFGDSNTWGRSGASEARYDSATRWTGLLQQQLGSQYEVIEEGLRSRTTNLDDDDPRFPGRNGLTYLRPCLESHQPLDLVILWLGTNDLKAKFHRSASEVGMATVLLIKTIRDVAALQPERPLPILLVSSPLVRADVLKPHSSFTGAAEKSAELGTVLETIASEHQCAFINLAGLVTAGDSDGVHLDPEAHQVVAKQLAQQVQNIVPSN